LNRTRFAVACLLTCLAMFLLTTAALGQTTKSQTSNQTPAAQPPESQSQPPAPPAQAQTQIKDAPAAKDEKANSKDRLFFALPNFLTVENAATIPPLTAGGKFKLVARSAFDPAQFVWYAALAGISQAQDSEPGFGQGAEGYGKRYGAYVADGTIENFMVGAVFPSMLRQDPRYFQLGKGSFFHRTGYAVTRIVVTRGDSGRNEFNASEVFGSALSSSISTFSYHPKRTFLGVRSDGSLRYAESDRTLKNAASVWGSQMGYDAITFVIKEFWPDIRRKMKK